MIMPDFKNILVATDFSPRASFAVERGAQLARAHKATLHLLHVMDKLLLQMFGRVLVEHPLVTEERLYESARARLKSLADTVGDRYSVAVQHQVNIGRTHGRIADYARSHGVDLTLLGAHGESFVRDVFIGSTALKFLRKGTAPALVVRSEVSEAYRDVLVAVDFSAISRMAVEAAAKIAPQASIHVLHVYEVPFEGKMRYAGIDEDVIQDYNDATAREARRMMNAFLAGREAGIRMSPIVKHGHAARVILKQARALCSDLIVMGKRGTSELDELLLGSVTKHVLFETDRDLLLVAPSAAPASGSA